MDEKSSDQLSAEEIPESKIPDDTAFRQQRIPAWTPTVTPKNSIPVFFAFAILFIPTGVVLLLNSDSILEVVYDYTDCVSLEIPSASCSMIRNNPLLAASPCTCKVNVTLDSSMEGDVYFHYGLSNFFQNHRRYVKSRDDPQLFGKHVSISSLNPDCAPPYSFDPTTLKPIAPCGAIANSLFNDTFTLLQDYTTPVPILRTGIAWPTDHRDKFNNPFPSTDLEQAFAPYARPLNWQRNVQDLDNTSISNNGYKNEALIVWMRTAAFSTFRKIYGRLNRFEPNFGNGLSSGPYELTVDYNYPVTAFEGRKRFIISQTSWMGGKNNFLGIAYIVFGVIFFATGIFLFLIHNLKKNKPTPLFTKTNKQI